MNYYATLGFVLWGYMTLWFLISLIRRRNDVADVAWGLGFVLLSVDIFLSIWRVGNARRTGGHLGQHLGAASGMAHPCPPSRQAGRFPLHGLETGMGQVVLCSLVCAGVLPAGRASIHRRIAGPYD